MKAKKIITISFLAFAFGLIVGFLGKSFEKTKFGQSLEKKLGIKNEDEKKYTAQGSACMEQLNEEESLFVGCNGVF